MGTLSPVLFDSNIIIDALNGSEKARQLLKRERGAAISVLSWMEILVGAREPDVEETTRELLGRMEQIQISPSIAEDTIQLRRTTKLKLVDACILATARSSGRTLLTRNTKDFDPSWPGVTIPYRL